MSSVFTVFPDLCNELQDLIWDQAIRGDEPAAQFFTVFDCRNASPPIGLKMTNNSSAGGGNKSAYMADSGLWTACWRSRNRMLRRFRPAETSKLMARRGPVGHGEAMQVCAAPTATVTLPFRRPEGSGGRKRSHCYLTIRPMRDLLYFDVASGSLGGPRTTSPSDCTPWWWFLCDLPEFAWDGLGRRKPTGLGPFHARHIAVKYDRKWWSWRSSVAYTPYIGRGAVLGLEVFWFVDYSLKRRYRAADDRSGRLTFRAGDDHEFVEVLKEDDEWWAPPSPQSGGRARRSEVHKLAREIEEHGQDEYTLADDDFEAEMEALLLDDTPAGTDRPAPPMPPRIGVLAYVKRGSERNLPPKSRVLPDYVLGSLMMLRRPVATWDFLQPSALDDFWETGRYPE